MGLSVTAPLKEKVIPYLVAVSDEAREMGAVNTLVRTERGWEGWNTDGRGAADCLGEVLGKRVVILGAGGAARAIGYELKKRGAEVVIVNRTVERGKRVADSLGCTFSEKVLPCDILINTTVSSEPPIVAPVVMDIAVRKTPFLEKARREGAKVMGGLEMFFNQAVAQQVIFNGVVVQPV